MDLLISFRFTVHGVALNFAYLLVNVDIGLVRGTACGVPTQELHFFENLFD